MAIAKKAELTDDRKIQKQAMKQVTWGMDVKKNWRLYILALPIIAFFAVFNYAPMFGMVMAFQNYKPAKGIFGSEWVGFKNFIDFFTAPTAFQIIRNTFVISFLGLAIGFPVGILFALLINEIHTRWFKKTVQTISYMPYFVTTIVICGLVLDFCSSNGIITNALVGMGLIKRQNLLTNPHYFWAINLLSDIWQGTGYGSIVFIAAISSVSSELEEAAAIDGANRLQRVWHITLPGIMPMIITMLIMKCGMLMTVGFDKILNLYNTSIYETADVISTYVMRMGINGAKYGYSTAVGLFNSVVNTVLLLLANWVSAKVADQSLF